MEKLVKAALTQVDFTKADAGTEELINLFKNGAVSLNDSERRGLRTMGEGREGYASTISRVALAYPECLPRMADPVELQTSLVNYDQMAGLLQKATKFREMIDDTVLAMSADIMKMADSFAIYLQTARNGNVSLDEAMGQIDEYNKRFATRKVEEVVVTPTVEGQK